MLVRGARQVGKSTAIRHLAKKFDHFLEVNFEEQRTLHTLFEGDLNPMELCENLSIISNIPIIPGKTLLFFDEIQACLPAISSLRFFYEKLPELHVITAGSLLEFALADILSFGVGMIRSMFVYPLSFDEFLVAMGEDSLLNAKQRASASKPLVEPLHNKLLTYLKRFLILGGIFYELLSFDFYDRGIADKLCQVNFRFFPPKKTRYTSQFSSWKIIKLNKSLLVSDTFSGNFSVPFN